MRILPSCELRISNGFKSPIDLTVRAPRYGCLKDSGPATDTVHVVILHIEIVRDPWRALYQVPGTDTGDACACHGTPTGTVVPIHRHGY